MVKIKTILDREMSRREFLGLIGLAILTIIGIPALLGILTEHRPHIAESGNGYGLSNYGH